MEAILYFGLAGLAMFFGVRLVIDGMRRFNAATDEHDLRARELEIQADNTRLREAELLELKRQNDLAERKANEQRDAA